MSRFFSLHGFTGTGGSVDVLDLDSPVSPLLGGHGPMPDLSRGSFEAEVNHWLAVVRSLGCRVHLLGYSMGSRLALAMLLRAPELFCRATLLGVNPGLESAEAREERKSWEMGWVRILQQEGLAAFESAWSSQALFATQRFANSQIRQAQREARLSHTSEGLAHAMRSLGLGQMPNFWTQLETLRVPTRLIVGGEDGKFRDIAARMASISSFFQVSEITGVGHNPILESAPAVRRIIDQDDQPESWRAEEPRP